MAPNEALSAPKSQIYQNELKFGMKSLFRVYMKIIILIFIGRNQEWSLGPQAQNNMKFGMKSLFWVCMKIIILILIGRHQERNLGVHDQNELKFSMKSLSWFYMKMETK